MQLEARLLSLRTLVALILLGEQGTSRAWIPRVEIALVERAGAFLQLP